MIVPKVKGEQLGVVIVESGWGSMVPTVVLANMSPTGPAARCGQLNIGDQIISVNGISLVGLPLSSCQTNIKVKRKATLISIGFCSLLLTFTIIMSSGKVNLLSVFLPRDLTGNTLFHTQA